MKISIKGLTKLNKRLTQMTINIQDMANAILKRLLELGYNEAEVKYDEVQYDGDNDIMLSIVWNDDTAKLVANGKSLLFIEFGSGIKYNKVNTNPLRNKVVPPVGAIGSYGKGQGATGKRWFYNKTNRPINPTDDYKGVGDTITYYETKQTKSGFVVRKRTRTLKTSSTKGNQPARGMYMASKKMHDELGNTIMEVVKKYVRH